MSPPPLPPQIPGMLETVRIRKQGFPIRYTFREFAARYWPIIGKAGVSLPMRMQENDKNTSSPPMRGVQMQSKEDCAALLNQLPGIKGGWQIGIVRILSGVVVHFKYCCALYVVADGYCCAL